MICVARLLNDVVSHLVDLLGSDMIRCKPQHLGEVTERLVNIVLIVETQTSNIDSVSVEVVNLEDRVGSLGGLGVSSKEGKTLGSGCFDGCGVVGDLQSLVQTPQRLPVVSSRAGLLAVPNHLLHLLNVLLFSSVVISQS